MLPERKARRVVRKAGHLNKVCDVARREPARSGANYTMLTRCRQCRRKHITVFRLRHVSDSFLCS